ncbi:MAG: hypothetical protein NXH70_15065 [Hyphomonas sp.]|nr:hypothetical protein [Hyphomonas sp.]
MSNGFYFFLAALVASLLALLSLAVVSVDYNHRAFDCDILDDSERIVSASVYYLDWSVLTSHALDIETVRSFSPIMLTSGARLDCLSSAIATNEMNLSFTLAAPRDGRFLLVGELHSGEQIEVYADRFNICSLTEDKCRKNDDETRARISFILKANTW